MVSLVNSTKYLKRNLRPVLYSVLQKIEEEGILCNHFMRSVKMLKPDKDNTKKTNLQTKSLMNIDTNISTKYNQIKSSNT